MTAIQTAGRTDLDALFRESGCLDGKLKHHPFLAFVARDGIVAVEVVPSAEALVARYAPDTPVMVQWAGTWSSDFFRMTVADVASGLDQRRREESCAICGLDLRRRGYKMRDRGGERVKLCHDCGDAHDAEHPRY